MSGHGQLEQLVWVLLVVIFAIVLLRLLGVAI